MINTLFKISFLFSFCLCFSQQDVLPSGGEAKSKDGSFSYSVGQILTTQVNPPSDAWPDEAITISHGVQQFFIPSCQFNADIKITAFPNPSKGLVNIELSKWDDVEIFLSVYDALGRSIIKKALSEKRTQLNLSQLNSGIYLFSIDNICGTSTTFKLILNN
ncbi:MAG: T9SS type A sorting domain-containing protein [Flavobacteriaceae bacterium]|nr:T9SS type A sorting domain-containing protein [Flavobacteriaceae bacterium]